jgi:hypothetical protein
MVEPSGRSPKDHRSAALFEDKQKDLPRIPANLRIPSTEHAACFATGERNNLSAGEVVGRM